MPCGLAAYYNYRGRTGKEDGTEPELAVEQPQSPVPVTPGTKSLPDDLSELLDIIQQAGGRLTQKELRSKMRCSVLAGVAVLVYPLIFRPLLAGFLSHSLLDIFLFDNSKGTIRQIIDIAITNDAAASEVNEAVVTGVAADGIMLLYPLSYKMYYILLTEQTYAVMVMLVLCTAAVTLYLTRNNKGIY